MSKTMALAGEWMGALTEHIAGRRHSDRTHALRTQVKTNPDVPRAFVVDRHADAVVVGVSHNSAVSQLYRLRIEQSLQLATPACADDFTSQPPRDAAIAVAAILAGQRDDGRVRASSSSRCVGW